MAVGVVGFYLLLLVGITAGLRKWMKIWLTAHCSSFLLWVFLSAHGYYSGTDSIALKPLYETALVLVIATFFWRHWTNNQKRIRIKPQVTEVEANDLKGGNSVELPN